MGTILAISAAILLETPVKTVKIPVYDFDRKSNAVMNLVVTKLPTGFSDPNPQSGKLTSAKGSISFSVNKSSQPIPSPQRNPEAKKGEVWSTIRLLKWIGWRNVKGNQEFYKLTWSTYRINAVLTAKSKSDLPELRKSLGVMCDNLTF